MIVPSSDEEREAVSSKTTFSVLIIIVIARDEIICLEFTRFTTDYAGCAGRRFTSLLMCGREFS